ncbi:MAG: carbamoyl phosphate synthase small subunit [Christensenellales bacterium]
MEQKAYLVLENGRVFEGVSFGAQGESLAEVVFTTGMTGYLETLTDPSYYGQTVVQTFPLIGNYGIIPEDFESNTISASAYIVKSWCEYPSNFRSQGNLDAFLKLRGIVGLYGIDTRALTKIIRESGVMNGLITPRPDHADMNAIKNYRVCRSVEAVSTKERYFVEAGNGKHKVVLMDFGMKENIKRSLLCHDCDVWVVPYCTSAQEIMALSPDGIMLSNGPGDPADNTGVIETLRQLTSYNVPIFGICLGHQLLALARGCKTAKLKYGHRGANQPAKDLQTGRVYITSQNHGYEVIGNTLDPAIGRELFLNVNDGTNEGIEYLDAPAFSVQFHPEACAGPQDSGFLFDRFIELMERCHYA